MRWWWLSVVLSVLAMPAYALPEDVPGVAGLLPDVGGWPDTGHDDARFAAAAAYSRRHGGLALVVVEAESVVFEAADNGFELDRAHHLWSGTKTFACALAVAAEADGKLALDARVGDILIGDLTIADARAGRTVQELLSLTSGLSESGPVLTSDMLRTRMQVPDKEAWVLRHIRQQHEPGARFRYAASPFVMFVAMAARAVGQDPIAYLEQRIFQPIGLRQTQWLRDGAGHPWLSFGAYTTARSWARFGMLLRDDGVFRGQRILPAGALQKCFVGTAAMPAYGLGLWLNREAKQAWLPKALQGRFARKGPILLPGGPEDLVAAAGYNDNRLYVVPSRDLVIVRFGRGHPSFEDHALLALLLGR